MPDYFDFMMFSSKRFSSGKIDKVTFKEELEKYQSAYKKIFESLMTLDLKVFIPTSDGQVMPLHKLIIL